MTEALTYLWLVALFGAPILALLWRRLLGPLPPRVAFGLAGAAALTVALSLSPISLPGHDLDFGLSAVAYGAFCVSLSALPNTHFQRVAALVLMLALAFPGAVGVIFSAPPAVSRTVSVVCGQRVRIESWGWVTTGGTAAVLLWRPWWSPVEVQQARKQFDFGIYPELNGETRFSAVPRGDCGVDVTYDGRRIGRLR